ncbi:MAG: RNA polymerase sigma factor SigY [Clostridium argentinense]|uniref:RNA polymerase sigma factor SigY n=1 Tax=Clostridium faecium TaxID=2762223 RepID=A0ABR8YQA7_9CLOT|nr:MULTISPECIES: RNA polymerase sigma factor SigY [Clostridium]MBD8046425.1 RNA polymerase sigma factor SigY [Clostridium faecium]MBS5823111.1 RNA polymerase sigma factor SigY [Clostridium argentinense]
MNDEKRLIEKAQDGNKSALNTLILNNYDILSGYILKMTGNADEASDIINDTVIKVTLNIKKYKPTGKFSTWMITIATNIYRDSLKKKKRFVSIENYEKVSNVDIEEEIINKLDYEKILILLKELPKEKRAVFILKHYYNYKYEEISKILNCPIGTVRSRLHYSVKYLMRRLEGGDN